LGGQSVVAKRRSARGNCLRGEKMSNTGQDAFNCEQQFQSWSGE